MNIYLRFVVASGRCGLGLVSFETVVKITRINYGNDNENTNISNARAGENDVSCVAAWRVRACVENGMSARRTQPLRCDWGPGVRRRRRRRPIVSARPPSPVAGSPCRTGWGRSMEKWRRIRGNRLPAGRGWTAGRTVGGAIGRRGERSARRTDGVARARARQWTTDDVCGPSAAAAVFFSSCTQYAPCNKSRTIRNAASLSFTLFLSVSPPPRTFYIITPTKHSTDPPVAFCRYLLVCFLIRVIIPTMS